MTLVNLTAEETVLGGFAAVSSGVVTATYWAGQVPYTTVQGADVRFPAKITVQIRDGQPVEPVELVPTRGMCCVRWKISDLRSGRSLSRYTEIPDAGPVDFGDLPVVDPATYQPADPTPTLLETINAQVAAYLVENPAASPEEIAAAVEAYLVAHPVEGVTQAELDAAIAAIELTPGPPGDPGEPGAPGPSAVSADAGNLLKLGTDNLVMLDPADLPTGGGGSAGWIEQPVPPETLGTATIWWSLRRDGNIVHCTGSVQGTPAGTSLGIIPIGYRPSESLPDSFSWPVARSGTTNIVNNFAIGWRTQARILAQSTIGATWLVSWPTDDPDPRKGVATHGLN